MRSRRISLILLASILSTGLGGACGGESGVLARFQSARSIPDQADTLEVRVFDAVAGTRVDQRSFPLAPIGAFPATLGFERGAMTPARVRLEGRALLGPTLVATGAVVLEFKSDENQQIDIDLVDEP